MTQVIKRIKGHEYYYFQDSIKIGKKNKVISTCIGRSDLESSKLMEAREKAFNAHTFALLKESAVVEQPKYHFKYLESSSLLEDNLEMLKIVYKQCIKNISPQELEEFEKTLFVKYVHGTCSIEGNTLTEQETYNLLASGLTPLNKTYNETVEISNYIDAQKFLDSYSGDISEKLIKHIHRLLMKGVRSKDGVQINAGEYRTNKAILKGIAFTPSPAEAISDRISYLVSDYHAEVKNVMHPIELAAYFHQKFEEIHPFQDGNGRTGRALLNFMLKRNIFPLIYITDKHRSEYLTALQKGNAEDYKPLIEFIISRIAGTMSYLYSKTSIYHQLSSKENAEAYESQNMREIYDKWMSPIHAFRESSELP